MTSLLEAEQSLQQRFRAWALTAICRGNSPEGFFDMLSAAGPRRLTALFTLHSLTHLNLPTRVMSPQPSLLQGTAVLVRCSIGQFVTAVVAASARDGRRLSAA